MAQKIFNKRLCEQLHNNNTWNEVISRFRLCLIGSTLRLSQTSSANQALTEAQMD